jgi:hypothetical protein
VSDQDIVSDRLTKTYDLQYVAKRDSSGTWRVLDSWNESLNTIEDNEDIPDSHAAVTLLTEGQYLSVIREATKGGYLQSAAIADELQAAKALQSNIQQPSSSSEVSESFFIKKMIITQLANLAQAENMIGLND